MTIRGGLLCVVLATTAILGCAKPAAYPDPIAPSAIDLRPRCEVDLMAADSPTPSFGAASAAVPHSLEALHTESAHGIPIFAESAPRSGLAILGWGFPLHEPDASSKESFAPRLGAALLRTGETASDPVRFRRRVLEIGGTLSSHVEGGWLWLELRYPETRSDKAFRVLSDWLRPTAADPVSFETRRRAVALEELVLDSSPTNLAARSFRRLHRPPPGALDPDALARDDPDATPEGVRRFLESALRFEDSVVLYAGTEEPSRIRASIEATLERVSPSFVSAWSDGEAWPSHVSMRDDDARADRRPKRDAQIDARQPEAEPTIYVVDQPGVAQVEILAGFPTLAPGDPEFAELELWASLLGGNVGGRLFRDLRERQGLAYIINAEQSMEGRFVVTTRSRPERVVALLHGIEAHLRALVEVQLEDCEVAMLRTRSAGEAAILEGDAESWTRQSRLDVATLGRPRATRASGNARLDGLRSDLEAVARERLAKAPTILLVGDADWLRHDLRAAFPKREIRIIDPNSEIERH